MPALTHRHVGLGCFLALSVAFLTCHPNEAPAAPDNTSLGTHSEPQRSVESENPISFVEFILEDEANCQSRESQHVIVHNLHPKRTIRVWLDRYYRNVPTGDRSRTDLLPGAEPEGLGCATVMNAKQEWRVVKAIFVE